MNEEHEPGQGHGLLLGLLVLALCLEVIGAWCIWKIVEAVAR